MKAWKSWTLSHSMDSRWSGDPFAPSAPTFTPKIVAMIGEINIFLKNNGNRKKKLKPIEMGEIDTFGQKYVGCYFGNW